MGRWESRLRLPLLVGAALVPIESPQEPFWEFSARIYLESIIAFVLETAGAGHPQRQLVRGRCLFYDNASSGDSLQDKYGFLYLGELLERYEARFGMALCDLRAIALALGYTMELLTDEMFVGSQRGDFLRKVRQQSQGDIYLTAARYLLADEKDAARWERTLLGTRYAKTEELLFAMSVLPDFAQAEQALRPQLNALLGAGRTLPVIGNMRLFDWLVSHALPHIKTMRGKDMALLRALCALPGSYVKPGSRPWGVLESQGYTAFGTACLNTRAALTLEGGLAGVEHPALGGFDILDLNQRRLSLDWLKEYSLPKLREACGRMAREIPEDVAAGLNVQRELIRHPALCPGPYLQGQIRLGRWQPLPDRLWRDPSGYSGRTERPRV